jgi:hypothetical protein
MIKTQFLSILFFISLSSATSAHHSRSNFDLENLVEMSGEVIQYRWANPHIYFKLKNKQGEEWNIEGHSIAGALVIGWQRDTIKVGDDIRIGVYPDKKAGKQFALLEWVITRDGVARQSFPESRLPAIESDEVTLVKHDRKDLLDVTPSTDFSGNWANDLSKLDLRVAGFGVPENLQLTEKGEAQKAVFNIDEDPTLDCIQHGMPRVLGGPYGFRFDRHDDRLVMQREHQNTSWTIWLDETRAPKDQVPSRFGLSIGKIEGNILRFTTTNLIAQKWGVAKGIDSSASMQVEGRFILHQDGKQIDLEYTTTDPVYLSEPYTQSNLMLKHLDREFDKQACDPEIGRYHLEID